MSIAIIKNGVVENIIAVDLYTKDSTIAHCESLGYICVETDQAGPGDSYDGNEFTRHSQQVRQSVLSKLDYMDRFTDAELAAIYTAAKSSVQVEVWLEKFKLATDINLDDQRTIDGLQALEAAGILATGRAAEILA